MLRWLSATSDALGTELSSSGEVPANGDEIGTWYYLVVDAVGIRPRDTACYDKACKRTDVDRIREGEIVEVNCRRRDAWTRWLRIASGDGWVFDICPKDRKIRMIEVEVSAGNWQYRVCSDFANILAKPSLPSDDPTRKRRSTNDSLVLDAGEILTVKERVRPLNNKGSFLRLADGRGWVLDFCKHGLTVQRWHETEGDTSPNEATEAAWSTLGEDLELRSSAIERGEWNYVVLDPNGIPLRSAPNLGTGSKLGKIRVEEGQLLTIVERQTGGGVNFLRVEDPRGWIADVHSTLSHHRQRAMEVFVETGSWYYRVSTPRGISLRRRCSCSVKSKIGKGPDEGALIVATSRVQMGQTTFLWLNDAGGWIFNAIRGKQCVEGPLDVRTLHGVTAIVRNNVYLQASPTTQQWAVTRNMFLSGARVQMDLQCELGGVAWVQVSQYNGLQGWVLADALDIGLQPSDVNGRL